MKEMLTFNECYFRDNNADNDANYYDDGDDECDERTRRLYLA
jgi:hypothetical protein